MFEEYTFETILSEMLSRVPNTVDKRQGSIIYDALAPAAAELQNMYINLDFILQQTFADTASREYLIKRAAERGIKPFPATKTLSKAILSPSSLKIASGIRFSCDSATFVVVDKISDGCYELECEQPGSNFQVGQIIPIDYIDGFFYGEITEILIPGEDVEDTETFRKRYFDSLNKQSFGGNMNDYLQKTNSIQGVGATKIYPVWNGGGTVKLVIIDSQFQSPSQELIAYVQNTIDPATQGTGLGIAPIGHVVTVTGASEQKLDIDTKFTLIDGYTWDDVKDTVRNAIVNYFCELNRQWADNKRIIVRISQIETRILNITSVIDISHTKINGSETNFEANEDSIVILGDVTNA